MAKLLAEQSNKISIFRLNKWGYICPKGGQTYGTLTWTWGDCKNSVIFIIHTLCKDEKGEDYMELSYSHTDHWSNNKESLRYRVELTTTECNYGGIRFWFRCPLMKNGCPCQGRVGVLYSVGKYFGCRHCANIAYESQRKGGDYRESSITEYDIEQLDNEIRKYFHKDRPTKKYLRLMKMQRRFSQDFIMFAKKLK